MITIYHNPRCSKSREGLALLEQSGKKFEVIKYLEDIISEKELKTIISKLGIEPIDLIRKNEAIWKSDYKSKELSDEQIIKAMIKLDFIVGVLFNSYRQIPHSSQEAFDRS